MVFCGDPCGVPHLLGKVTRSRVSGEPPRHAHTPGSGTAHPFPLWVQFSCGLQTTARVRLEGRRSGLLEGMMHLRVASRFLELEP